MNDWFNKIDSKLVNRMRKIGIPVLRLALGIIFLWFGALKIFGASPVSDLIRETYSFLPQPQFTVFLGVWEAAIGLGLLFKITLRATLVLLWFQLLGTLVAPFLAPFMFFQNGNPLLLTMAGEFVVKNLVLVAAGLVIGGHELKK